MSDLISSRANFFFECKWREDEPHIPDAVIFSIPPIISRAEVLCFTVDRGPTDDWTHVIEASPRVQGIAFVSVQEFAECPSLFGALASGVPELKRVVFAGVDFTGDNGPKRFDLFLNLLQSTAECVCVGIPNGTVQVLTPTE